MTEPKTLCMVPWLHRFTNEQGLHQLCCTGTGPANQLRNEHGQPLDVSQQLTDAELLNSPDVKAVRLAMLRGEWPAACERCRRSEEAGAISNREHMNRRFGHWSAEALADTAEDGTLDRPRVRYADIRLGNVCNLTCRMCGPSASRLWAEHYQRSSTQPIPGAGSRAHFPPRSQLGEEPAFGFFDGTVPAILGVPALRRRRASLIIPEMLEALDLCIQAGRADQIDLSYNTNITVIPDRVARLWPYFRSVSVHCACRRVWGRKRLHPAAFSVERHSTAIYTSRPEL